MDFILLYHFGKLKGVAIEIFQVLIDDITTNMIFEILAIKFLSEIEKYLSMATLMYLISYYYPFSQMVHFLLFAVSLRIC